MSYDFIFGTGRALENRIADVPLQRIKAFVDNDAEKWGTQLYGKRVISPAELHTENVHRVYIASKKFFSEIYVQLIEKIGISAECVKGLYSILPNEEQSLDGNRSVHSYHGAIVSLFDTLTFLGAAKVCASKAVLRDYGVLSFYDKRLEEWRSTGHCQLTDQLREDTDAVLLGEPLTRMSFDALVADIRRLQKKTDAPCVFYAGAQWDDESDSWIPGLQRIFPCLSVRQYAEGMVVVVWKKQESDARIFTVIHKPYEWVLGAGIDAGYSTILAGARGKEVSADFRDDCGDNISWLNEKINECTAMYWVWKNHPQNVVGFCHYRRYFLKHERATALSRNILSTWAARRALEDVDFLVADPVANYTRDGVYHGLVSTTSPKAFHAGWEIVRRNLTKYQPDFLQPFDDVMHGCEMYPCNMFVTRWKHFDAYCRWQFSFFIPSAEEADVSRFDAYSKRIIGFFAERMLTVWLVKHSELRIRTLPILQTDG